MRAIDLLDFGGVLTLYSFLDTSLGLVLSPHKPFMWCVIIQSHTLTLIL